MKIETTFPTADRANFSVRNPATRSESASNRPDFAESRSLEMALAEVPDVRVAAVARGRALIADPNYPSKAQLKTIARKMVDSGMMR